MRELLPRKSVDIKTKLKTAAIVVVLALCALGLSRSLSDPASAVFTPAFVPGIRACDCATPFQFGDPPSGPYYGFTGGGSSGMGHFQCECHPQPTPTPTVIPAKG